MYFSKDEIDKLLNYLEEKAEELGKGGRISDAAYYPGRHDLADYRWLIIDVAGLGTIRLYCTSVSNVIKINNVEVHISPVSYDRLAAVSNKLNDELNKYKVEKSKGWFNNK